MEKGHTVSLVGRIFNIRIYYSEHCKYPFTPLSMPDFEADTGHIYKLPFQIAAQEAGLELFQSANIASRSALAYYGIEDCYGPYESPYPGCPSADERVNVVLSVSYSGASLGVTLLTRWMTERMWGTFWPSRLSETPSLVGTLLFALKT